MARSLHTLAGIAILQATLFATFCGAQAAPAEVHNQRARQLIAEGRTEAAIAEYEAAATAQPANLEAQGNLGVLRYFANDCVKALPHLSAALALDPSQARIQALLGICQRRQDRIEEAERNLTAALPQITNPKIHTLALTNLVEIQYARGDLPKASANVAELIKGEGANPDTLYLAYRIYTDLADAAKDALIVAAPDSARAHLLTAQRAINASDATTAIQQYRAALDKDPSLLGVHYELGEAILRDSTSEDSLKLAEAELLLAFKEDPRNAGAEAKLGILEGIRGHAKLAEEHYARALVLKPDEFDAMVGMADILRERGENEKAVDYLSRAVKLDPMADSLHFKLAQIYRALGRKEDADKEMKLFASVRSLKSKASLADLRRVAP